MAAVLTQVPEVPQVPPVAAGIAASSGASRAPAIVAGAILAAGIALRLVHWAAFNRSGFDERLYAHYLGELIKVGLPRYPDIVDDYIAYQKTIPGSILPPTRFLYIFCAYLWHGVFGTGALGSFYAISRAFSVLTLLAGGRFMQRLLGGGWAAVGALALFAFSPLQIHLAQHALVDGFFEFWAMLVLWTLWEALRQPGHRGWLTAYTLALALMVATKENAFFVFVAVLALLGANRWLRFGTIMPALLALTAAGPLIGLAILTNVAGGLPTLCDVYLIGVPKNLHLDFAIATGDGPWYRYLLDFAAVTPLVTVLALARMFQVRRTDQALWFLMIFIGASYVLMANVKYGLNLRYGTIWDLPLRVLAVTQCALLAAHFGRRSGLAFAVVVAGLCAFDLSQYDHLAVQYPLYELVPADLLRALHILKG